MTLLYTAPDGLPLIEATASCHADVTIKVQEPYVDGTSHNITDGTSWTGVEGVMVRISDGRSSFDGQTNSTGTVSFNSVPCGSYQASFSQDQFDIINLSERSVTVSAAKKSGREFEFEIKRQLLTVEMFRLATQYVTSILSGIGVDKDLDQDPYGHHWVKIYADESAATRERPMESYGWWPIGAATPERLWSGVPGSLNGVASPQRYPDATPTTDPYHTHYNRADKKLEAVFFPYVTNGKTADQYKSAIREKAKAYARVSGGIWSWRGNGGGFHCKTFQTYLMREVRLWQRLGAGVGNWGWSVGT